MSATSVSACAFSPISAPIMRMAVYTPSMSVASLTTTRTPLRSSCSICSGFCAMSFISSTCGCRARISSTLVFAPDCTTGLSRISAG